MLIRLLFTIAIIGLLITLIRHIRKQPDTQRPKLIVKYSLYALIAIIILLVIMGKVHWIAAAIAALLPALQKLIFVGLRFLPFINQWRNNRQQQQHQKNNTHNTSGKMTVAQAKDIFGIKNIESVEQITKRHRELMQKNHPDRGGSDYLAAQINQAKEILIEHINQQ